MELYRVESLFSNIFNYIDNNHILSINMDDFDMDMIENNKIINKLYFFSCVENRKLYFEYKDNPNFCKKNVFSSLMHFFDTNKDIPVIEQWEIFEKTNTYKLSKGCINVEDFMNHFYKFENTENYIRFERKKAEEVLSIRGDRFWLIRFSSYNRTYKKKLYNMYYSFSFILNDKINHVLFKYVIGKGWYIVYTDKKIHFYNFIDLLKYLFIKHDLSIVCTYGGYFMDD